MSRGDGWPAELIFKLIHAFREHPVLWDRKNRGFYNSMSKANAWQMVARKLNLSAKTCRHKMMVLMSSYRREKSKLMESISGDHEPDGYFHQSKWYAFNEMAFLLDLDSERRRHREGNVLGVDESAQDIQNFIRKYKGHKLNTLRKSLRRKIQTYEKKNEEEQIRFETESDSEPSSREERETGKKRKFREEVKSRENRQLCGEPQPGEEHEFKEQRQSRDENKSLDDVRSTNRNKTQQDEIEAFANFIACKMRKYSEKNKNDVQKSICQIIFEADQKNGNMENPTTSGPVNEEYDFNTFVVKEEFLGDEVEYLEDDLEGD